MGKSNNNGKKNPLNTKKKANRMNKYAKNLDRTCRGLSGSTKIPQSYVTYTVTVNTIAKNYSVTINNLGEDELVIINQHKSRANKAHMCDLKYRDVVEIEVVQASYTVNYDKRPPTVMQKKVPGSRAIAEQWFKDNNPDKILKGVEYKLSENGRCEQYIPVWQKQK